ncbi:MAG: hypothetical protein NVS2B6_15440 [Thermoleophilaceae bacterium]
MPAPSRAALRSRLPSPPRAVWALLALALVLRVGLVLATLYTPTTLDAADFSRSGLSIAQGHGYPLSNRAPAGGPSAFRPPAYPFFLAAVYAASGQEAPPVARLDEALLGTATVILVGLIATRIWGRRTGRIALAMAAVAPPLVVMSTTLISEALFVPLMLAAVAAALRARDSARPLRWAVASGLLVGLCELTRTNAAVLLLPLAIAVWGATPRPGDRFTNPRVRFASAGSSEPGKQDPSRGGATAGSEHGASRRSATAGRVRGIVKRSLSRRALAAPAALLTAAVLTVAPWTIRNAVVLHAFVPVSTEIGYTLAGTYNLASRADHHWPAVWKEIEHGNSAEYSPIYFDASIHGWSELKFGNRLERAAFADIRRDPSYVLTASWWNLMRILHLRELDFAIANLRDTDIPRVPAWFEVIGFYALGALALAGIFTRAVRRAPPWLWLIPLGMLSTVFVTGFIRFRAPVDPFLVMLAAVALDSLRARTRRTRVSRPLR